MRMLKSLIIIIASVLLFACASQHSTGKMGDNGPQNSGLGIGPNFNGETQYTQQQLLAQKTILFAFDKTTIQEQYRKVIEAHAKYLSQHPRQVILLAGNTDEQGSREYNMGLGERRAQSVADVLLANGVAEKQLIKVSYGPEVPVACGQNQAAYAQNRRVDILYCKSNNCNEVAKRYAHKLCTNNS